MVLSVRMAAISDCRLAARSFLLRVIPFCSALWSIFITAVLSPEKLKSNSLPATDGLGSLNAIQQQAQQNMSGAVDEIIAKFF